MTVKAGYRSWLPNNIYICKFKLYHSELRAAVWLSTQF